LSVRLSILMPVYNEEATLLHAVERVLAVDYPCEIELVVVDDGSSDRTPELIASISDERLTTFRHPVNAGKGAAIRTAVGMASGDYLVPCDADLEYAPEEIPDLLAPVMRGEALVVYGNRTFGSRNAYSFWYVMGNKAVTTFGNVLFDCYLSDLETCYKLLPTQLYRDLDVRSTGFGMEAELTAKLLARGIRPFEVPISYHARTREQGKKLTWRDGVEALAILTRVRLRHGRSPVLPDPVAGRHRPISRDPEADGPGRA
jgi:dolichol-phosphate hexosyltransferase